MIEGRHGVGKSTLAGRLAYGLCEQSHTVTYLSTERRLGRFLDQMRSLSYDIQKPLLRREFIYLFGDLTGGEMDDNPALLSRLEGAQQLWQSDVVILDTFSDILLYDPTVAALTSAHGQRQAIQRIISFCRQVIATGTTIVLLVSPIGLPDQTLNPLRAVADVLLNITVDNSGSRLRREINARRFAGMGSQAADKIGFSIRPNTGIVINTRKAVRR